MWKLLGRLNANININSDHLTKSAGAALLCHILTQNLSDRQYGLQSWSETLSWILLPFICKTAKASAYENRGINRKSLPDIIDLSTYKSPPASSLSLWVVALSITTYWLFAVENALLDFIPQLTPLLLLSHRYLVWPDTDIPTAVPPKAVSQFFFRLANTVCGTVLSASLAVLTLKSDWHYRALDTLSLVPVLGLLVAYSTLDPRRRIANKIHQTLPPFDMEDAIIPLSLRVIAVMGCIMGLESLAFGFPTCTAVSALVLGLTKALSWYFTIQMARHASWRPAAAMLTFTFVSTRDPFKQSSAPRAFLHVLVSFISTGQIIHMIPEKAKAKSILWVFFLVSLVPFLINTLASRNAYSVSLLAYPQMHPVQTMIQNSKAEFENLLQNQSKTYVAAHNEYQRRYGLEPPSGFEVWFNYARLHQSPIIDEFDVINESIAPFWSLSGQEVLDIMSGVQDIAGSELWLCTFSGQDAKTACSHPHRTFDRHIQLSFDKLLGDLKGRLPDINLLVNHIDEPRVLIPRYEGTYDSKDITLNDMSKQPIWETLTRSCSFQEVKQTKGRSRNTSRDFGLPFITDPFSAKDLCQHPEYNSTHGLAISPTSFRLIEGLVPVLSSGSLSTMGDILYPSPAYLEQEFEYNDAHDVEWHDKRNNLYWAGSTTGGFASDEQWRNYHRQRFVELAQNLKRRQHHYLREPGTGGRGGLSRVASSFLNTRLFDVAFTRVFQCERRYCRQQQAYFDVKPWADQDRALKSRLVYDTDGNGISGRYYKFLASRSCPLKQTLLREWHDDRLVPWLHYVPVSQGLDELPELVMHLTSTEAGQAAAEHIAEQGREWFAKAFREVDRTVYLYRLLLELARLQDPKRPRMT